MTRKEASLYFEDKYYEFSRKHEIYERCKDNKKLKDLCVKYAIETGLNGLQVKSVGKIQDKDLYYFLAIGDHVIEVLILLTHREIHKEDSK
jgi:hypothetical protein